MEENQKQLKCAQDTRQEQNDQMQSLRYITLHCPWFDLKCTVHVGKKKNQQMAGHGDKFKYI